MPIGSFEKTNWGWQLSQFQKQVGEWVELQVSQFASSLPKSSWFWINAPPDDVKAVATPLLRHRLILKPEALLDGLIMDAVIASLLNQVPVPR